MRQLSLVDYLAYTLELEYVSDLHFPEKIKTAKLKYLLERELLLEDFPEKDWLDACEYMCGQRSHTKEEARQYMEKFVSEMAV